MINRVYLFYFISFYIFQFVKVQFIVAVGGCAVLLIAEDVFKLKPRWEEN